MTRVQVLLLITELNVGGAERIVAQLATHLPRDRYQVRVACLYAPHAVGADIEAAGIPVINLDMRGKGDLRAPLRLLRLLRREPVDVLHAHLFHANFLAATVGKAAGVPVVIATRHSIEIGGRLRERINRATRPLCDTVVAVSREVYQAEIDRSGIDSARVTLIPSGVELDRFAAPDPAATERLRRAWHIQPETKLIGTVGRLVPPKGHTYLLDAATRLRDRAPKLRIAIVGDGPLRPALEAQTRSLGLSDTVIFTGIRREVPEILALLDLFVLPSLWEGLPIALLEAMAAGRPVVATRVGGVPEVVVDGTTGRLVATSDPDALANAILTLLQDPDLRRRMGAAGQARVRKHFSVERMVKDMDQLYCRLLAQREAV
jgi:sugar transferase (PEP-CTERM/EpsH1 system associated)